MQGRHQATQYQKLPEQQSAPESRKWLTEDQGCRRQMISSSPTTLPPLDTLEDWEGETSCWQGMGVGSGQGANSYDDEKAGSPINH